MKKVMVTLFILLFVLSISFVIARSIGSVTDTQGSTRNVGYLECDRNCSIDFRIDKINCAGEYKESKKLCRDEYKSCKAQAKLLRWVNRTEYTNAKITCRDNYRSCINETNTNRTSCKQEAENNFNLCKQECREIKNSTCLDNSQCSLNQFCSFSNCTAQGSCINIPQICTEEFIPVCSCTNQTFSNFCVMQMNNESLQNEGECS